MNATTVAVDLAKNVFEIAVADKSWKVVDRARLTRAQFARWFENRAVDLVVMEACGSAHHWARTLRARGIEVRLLPAQYVRAYVKRNKTDAADAAALLEAARASDIKPVSVKSIEQQALQALHRMRSGWMSTRTRRINTLRGFCREFGLEVPVGAVRGTAQIARLLADEHSGLPAMLRTPMRLALEEIRLMEARIEQLERARARRDRAPKPRLPSPHHRAWRRPAHQHRHGGGRRRSAQLRFGAALLQLPRPHPARVLLGRQSLPGAHLQAR